MDREQSHHQRGLPITMQSPLHDPPLTPMSRFIEVSLMSFHKSLSLLGKLLWGQVPFIAIIIVMQFYDYTCTRACTPEHYEIIIIIIIIIDKSLFP